MHDTLVKTRKLGGSLIVRIPKEIVDDENIREGELVRLNISKVRKSGFGSLKGIGSMSREDELDEKVRN